VVKGQDSIRTLALVNFLSKVDLPTEGGPIKTTVASPSFLGIKPKPPLFFLICFSLFLSLAILAFNLPM